MGVGEQLNEIKVSISLTLIMAIYKKYFIFLFLIPFLFITKFIPFPLHKIILETRPFYSNTPHSTKIQIYVDWRKIITNNIIVGVTRHTLFSSHSEKLKIVTRRTPHRLYKFYNTQEMKNSYNFFFFELNFSFLFFLVC